MNQQPVSPIRALQIKFLNWATAKALGKNRCLLSILSSGSSWLLYFSLATKHLCSLNIWQIALDNVFTDQASPCPSPPKFQRNTVQRPVVMFFFPQTESKTMILLQKLKDSWLPDLLSQPTPRGRGTRLFIHSHVNTVVILVLDVSGPAQLSKPAANFQRVFSQDKLSQIRNCLCLVEWTIFFLGKSLINVGGREKQTTATL